MLGPAVAAAAWYGGIPWQTLVLGGAFIGVREGLRIVRVSESESNTLLGYLVAGALIVPAGLGPTNPHGHLLPMLGLAYAIWLCFLAQFARAPEERSLDDFARTLAVGLYVAGMASFLVGLRDLPDGRGWTLALLALTWTNDSFAYLGGRRFGRRPMAPHLSPKKTWEGFWIALVACLLVSAAALRLLDPSVLALPNPRLSLPALALIVSTIGPLGDISISFLKRQTGVKDSGHLIPGHGGVLDRTDSLLLAAPFVYSLAILFAGL